MKTITKTTTVTEDKLAVNVGSGDLRVFATPAVAALVENAAAELAAGELSEGITTVGVKLDLDHIAPTPIGAEVRADVSLTETDGRSFSFSFQVFDKAGKIAFGTHRRVSVKAEKFQRKANEKFDEV